MQNTVSSSNTKLYGFLSNDIINNLILRIVTAANLDTATQMTYNLHLFRHLRLRLDTFVVDQLTDKDLEKLYDLKQRNASQAELLQFFKQKIPQFEQRLELFLEQLFQEKKKALHS